MDCLNCDADLEDYMDWDYQDEIIECPECKHRMVVKYDEWCADDYSWCSDIWWVEEVDKM